MGPVVDDPTGGSGGNGRDIVSVCGPKREGLPASVSCDPDGTASTTGPTHYCDGCEQLVGDLRKICDELQKQRDEMLALLRRAVLTGGPNQIARAWQLAEDIAEYLEQFHTKEGGE